MYVCGASLVVYVLRVAAHRARRSALRSPDRGRLREPRPARGARGGAAADPRGEVLRQEQKVP